MWDKPLNNDYEISYGKETSQWVKKTTWEIMCMTMSEPGCLNSFVTNRWAKSETMFSSTPREAADVKTRNNVSLDTIYTVKF